MGGSMKDFEAKLDKITARGTKEVPAVIMSAFDSKGKEIYSHTSGYNGLSPTAPAVKKDATLWMASCTKLLTSIAAIQCVERGLVRVDDPVETILPELKDMDIVSMTNENDPSTLKIEKAKVKITLRHLLTHTSGLAYEFVGTNPQYEAWREKTGTGQVEGTVVKYYNGPLLFEPGTGWRYSPGIDWAGMMVVRLNDGITLGEYFQKNIFGRLGGDVGKSSTFRLDSDEAKAAKIRKRLLVNTLRKEDGSFVEQKYGWVEEGITEDSGGAGLWSTVPDYSAVLADLVSPDPKVLSVAAIDKYLLSPWIKDRGAIKMIVVARTNMTPDDDAATDEDPSLAGINHSLGGMLWLKDGDVLPKGTVTWGGLPNLKWFVNRDKGIAALFAPQVTPAGDQTAQDLAATYFKEIWKMVDATK